MPTKKTDLPRAASPEAVGVYADVVEQFIEYIQREELEFHSLMVLRHGKVAVEWYNEPFDAHTKHTMYSVSKSFTATAIGFAVSEGLLSLDDKVVDFFPDYPPKTPHPYFDKMTVRTLITMTAGKQTDMLEDKGKIDWIADFINSPWVFEPGTEFLYVNENIYMLCAILHRVTNMSVIEYLTPRLFAPLGIEIPFWETDQNGVEAGGWGLYITTEDLAKFADCYLHDGKYRGKRVIPAAWVKEATANQLPEGVTQPCQDLDMRQGYGYCFWMNGGIPNSYRADGMFSQFAIVLPDYDACIVTTAAVPIEQQARDAIWKFFPYAFVNENTEKEAPPKFETSLIERPAVSPRSMLEPKIDGRTIKVRKKIFLNLIGFPMSMLPLAVTFMMSDRAGNIDNIKFRFQEHECAITWDEGDENNTVDCGMDGHYRYGTMTLGKITFKVCANAVWLDDVNLKISIRPIETIGKRELNFLFKRNDRVTITPTSTPSTYKICDSLIGSFKEVIKNPVLAKAAQILIRFAPPVAEPKHYGKFKD